MRKGPGFIARMYGRRNNWRDFLAYKIQTPDPASKMGEHLLCGMDFAKIEKRTLATYYDFRAAAGETLSAVSADPRNHFGKYALRRFGND